jgi:predicted transcriptional regulator
VTDIPQPTLGRILGSFQDRNWLVRDGETYSLTLRGQLIANQFIGLLDSFETIQHLPTNGDFEPILELGFDPQWLRFVDVITPDDTTDWYGHLRQVRNSIEQVDSVREIAPGPLPGIAELLLEYLSENELSIESIFSGERFESLIADSQERSLFADVLRTGNASIYLVDDSIRYYIARHGTRAILDVPSTTGGPIVRLATDQQTVLNWVDSTIDELRDRADPVTLDDLVD